MAVFTLEEHEVARHSRRSYKLRQWYPEVIEKALCFISALWANVFIVTDDRAPGVSDAHFRRISQLIYQRAGIVWLTINATWFTTDWFVVCVRWTDGFRSLLELAGI